MASLTTNASVARSFSCFVPKTRYLQSSSGLLTTHQLTAKMSLCRQNYPPECEAGVNRQINLELYASYVYLSMAYYFDRDDVALPGFHKYFKKLSNEERQHAKKLMKYQNQRGGQILLHDIKKPDEDVWGNGLEAMETALRLEKHVNQSLLELHNIAESKNDPQVHKTYIEKHVKQSLLELHNIAESKNNPQFEDFLEDEFLTEQVEAIKEISDYIRQLNRVGPGLGEYIFDQETLQERK